MSSNEALPSLLSLSVPGPQIVYFFAFEESREKTGLCQEVNKQFNLNGPQAIL